jgi:oxygen-independent coproporphyrinogen-3 oxidase
MSQAPYSLYLHVPFCRRRCHYCHFDIQVSHPRVDQVPLRHAFAEALLQEANYYAPELAGRQLQSIYFGGGTPSLLGNELLLHLLNHLLRLFQPMEDIEVTFEANPEDLPLLDHQRLQTAGFNRISIGVQTLDLHALRIIARPPTDRPMADLLAELPRYAKGRSIDLMLGLPQQSKATLRQDLAWFVNSGFEHLSLYMLERDLPSPIDKKADQLPDEDQQAAWYEWAHTVLKNEGFQPYELSNFARPSFQCRHNLNYWRCGDYLGLGPAASGRMGLLAWRNEARLHDWLAGVATHGHGQAERSLWSEERMASERKIQAMRLEEGVPLETLAPAEVLALQELERAGLLSCKDRRLALTLEGRLLANEVFEIFL